MSRIELTIPVCLNEGHNGAQAPYLLRVPVRQVEDDEAPVVAWWHEAGGRIHEYRAYDDELWMPILPEGDVDVDGMHGLIKGLRHHHADASQTGATIMRESGLVASCHVGGYAPFRPEWQDADWEDVGGRPGFGAIERIDERVIVVSEKVWVRSTGPVVHSGLDWNRTGGMTRSRPYSLVPALNAQVVSAFSEDDVFALLQANPKLRLPPGDIVRVEGDVQPYRAAVLSESAEWALWSFLWSERRTRATEDTGIVETLLLARDAVIRRHGKEHLLDSNARKVAVHLPVARHEDPEDLVPVLQSISGLGDRVKYSHALSAAEMNLNCIGMWQEQKDIHDLAGVSI